MSYINQNIKYLRKQRKLTQEQLASKIGVKRSLIGAYEEGRAEPNISNIIKFAEVLDVGVNEIISLDLSIENPVIYQSKKDVRVLSITVDYADNENIHLVPVKAAAGYLNGYSDPEYISELPVFNVPGMKNGTFRAFEISGDSMLPLVSGTIIVSRYIEDWETIKNGTLAIVVTETEGLVFKRLFQDNRNEQSFLLVSDNTVYDPYKVELQEIKEIWEAKAYFSTTFPKIEQTIFSK